MTVKFHVITLHDQKYQQVKIPNGAAPVGISKAGTGYHLIYIGEPVLDAKQGVTEVGVYLFKTGEEVPDSVIILPRFNELIGQMMPPNARYVGTVDDTHLVLGNPKIESAGGLIV